MTGSGHRPCTCFIAPPDLLARCARLPLPRYESNSFRRLGDAAFRSQADVARDSAMHGRLIEEIPFPAPLNTPRRNGHRLIASRISERYAASNS